MFPDDAGLVAGSDQNAVMVGFMLDALIHGDCERFAGG